MLYPVKTDGERAIKHHEPNFPDPPVAPRVHRYRSSRPWSVAGLAGLSSVTAMIMMGGVAASVRNVGTQQRERLGQSLFGLVGNAQAQPTFGTSGGWRIQVGTFSSRDGALARLEATVRSVPELAEAGAQPSPYGALTRAQFVGLPDVASADAMCARIIASGTGCFTLPPLGNRRLDDPQGEQRLADE